MTIANQKEMEKDVALAENGFVAVNLLVDARRKPDQDAINFALWMQEREIHAELVVTKIDKVSKDRVAEQLMAVADLVGPDSEIVPVSATSGAQLDVLVDVLVAQLPPGPAFYPDGELTDEPEEVLMAELIREAALEGVRDELPHSLAVVIDEVEQRPGRPEDDPLIDVYAILYVERESQKGIVIGKGGARLREVGTAARTQIEKLLGTKVFLDLRVKIAKNWQRDPKQLGRLGF